MGVTVERTKDDLCRILVEGEMTIYTAQELKDQLLAPLEQYKQVELNLGAVTEIDSAGLQLLVLVKTEAHAQDRTLSITDHSPCVLDILDLCDLEGFFGDTVLVHVAEPTP
ncbi:STAS domain-containing protein [Rhodoferax saidenbachensis]|uniref:Anti-anti-sigma factor n=1 Tax=Rhodoferax saidenbachensis TaxID=1484693 RepID=A0ABU1ZVS9_9BURK|nr:STAS domain-containing protein [Rhodoferax saidenbachensis]MDR7308656.1 anti-anti-sigma factor [Rhodoferax saidenbachensis]